LGCIHMHGLRIMLKHTSVQTSSADNRLVLPAGACANQKQLTW
jgi:hypothetical protein